MKQGILKTIRRKGQYIAYSLLPNEWLASLYFRAVLGYKPNFQDPQTFNEKLCWYKMKYCPYDETIISCADKFEVRKYIIDKGMGQYLNDLIGAWDNVDQIDWESLPHQFALKCSHGCAYNIICSNKDELDISRAKKQLSKWMKEDFGRYNIEPHYCKVPAHIICEKYLGAEMIDYKFYCCNGIVKFMYISQGLDHDDTATISFFDRKGSPLPYHRADYAVLEDAKIPDQFGKMLELSEQLASDFPFVRVDWFISEGNIYFSELTFTPCAGMTQFEPQEYDRILGKEIIFDLGQ